MKILFYSKEKNYIFFNYLLINKGCEGQHIILSICFVPNWQSIMFFTDQTGGMKVRAGLLVTSDGGKTSLVIIGKSFIRAKIRPKAYVTIYCGRLGHAICVF